MKFVVALLKGACIYFAWGALYLQVSVLDPVTAPFQFSPVSVYIPIPVDLACILDFVISAVAFVGYEAMKDA